MRGVERLWELAIGRITFPATNYLYNRKGILRIYKEEMASEFYPREQLRDLQLRKLQSLIQYAGRWVPFYQKRFAEIGLFPEDVKTLEDIRQIPVLTRQDVVSNLHELVDIRLQKSVRKAELSRTENKEPIPMARFRKHKLVIGSSSGSTGKPIEFFEDGSITALSWAHELRLKRWFGFPPGTREARLQVRATRYEHNRKVRMRKHLWNQLTLPGQVLSRKDQAMNLRLIQEFQPRILWGHTSALTGLAEHIRHSPNTGSTYPVGLVTTWAAPLYAHEKKLLEEVFQCPVTNVYGSKEVGHIAATCANGRLHVNQEYFFLESSSAGPSDSPAELLVTLLSPEPMPFIRYQIGDLGEISDDRCPCGRSLQIVKALLGRTADLYTTEDGRQIPLTFWTGTFGQHPMCQSVERFQIVYRQDRRISIRILRRENYSEEVESAIWKHLREGFPPETRFEFEYPARIDPQPSGKYQIIVTESDS